MDRQKIIALAVVAIIVAIAYYIYVNRGEKYRNHNKESPRSDPQGDWNLKDVIQEIETTQNENIAYINNTLKTST